MSKKNAGQGHDAPDPKDSRIAALEESILGFEKRFADMLSQSQSAGLPVEPAPMPPENVCLNGRTWVHPNTLVVPEEYANPLDKSQILRYMRILQKGEKPKFGQAVYRAKDVPNSWDPPARAQRSVILDQTGNPIDPSEQEKVETQDEMLARMAQEDLAAEVK